MSKKTTIGLNPLEEYLSSPKASAKKPEKDVLKEPETQEVETQVLKVQSVQVEQEETFAVEDAVEVDGQGQLAIKGTRISEEISERPSKQRITLHISSELVDRVKNAVYWEPGLTVAGFAEEAFTNMIDQLEKERGEPFPQRKHHRLRGGRPVS